MLLQLNDLHVVRGSLRVLSGINLDLRQGESIVLKGGATVTEAVQPFFRKAVRASMTPIISSMATLGIVSLPGMMTGQILGGAQPLTAAKYQIAIMVGIYLSMICAIGLNLRLSLYVTVSSTGLLKSNIFTSRAE